MVDEDREGRSIELIFCDVHMPDMTGLEFLKWLRSTEQFRSVPLLIVSSTHDKNHVIEAGRLGVSGFLIKPVQADKLKERLESLHRRVSTSAANPSKAC
jgi:two-component system, chemotaxis family, chemotaxis protein CheY